MGTCEGRRFSDYRDKALLLFLYDSGVRAAELLALSVRDLDLHTGAVQVAHGKGDKARTTYVGPTTKRFILMYW